MKKLVMFLIAAIIGIFSQMAFARTEYTQNAKATTLEVSGDSQFSGSIRLVPDTLTYASLRTTNTISAFGKSFIVVNGTAAITMASTPIISTMSILNGHELRIMGGANTVTFTDNGTLDGSLMELGASTRAVTEGSFLDMVYYSGKWYERFNPQYSLDQSLLTSDNVSFADVTTTDDVIVGDDVAVTGKVTVTETLSVTGNSYFAPSTAFTSTFTASNGNQAWTGDVTTGDDVIVGDDLNVTGLATITETLDVNGNSTLGANLYVTTNTAASGAWAMPATLDVNGAVTLNSTLDVDGNIVAGAALYRSTFTAASGAQAWTGATTHNGGIVATTLAMTGALTNVGSGGVKVSTATTSTAGMRLMGAVVTLSTHTINYGDVWIQQSDNTVYMSTRTVAITDNDATCAGVVCYVKLSN